MQLALIRPDWPFEQPIAARGEPERDTWWERTQSTLTKALSVLLSPAV